jgi:hypothetical protein
MKTIPLVLVFALLSVLDAHAQGKGASGDRYFYPVAETESSDWVRSTPDCKKLPAKQYAELKKGGKCKADDSVKGMQRCDSGESAELTHVSTDEKKKFPVTWFVFGSKKACDADRESFLNGDV